MSHRKIGIVLSDSHANFILGLANPQTTKTNEPQDWLWNDVYVKGIDIGKKLAGKDDIFVIHVGDITHGNKYNAEQMSTKISEQFIGAADNFQPIVALSNVKSITIANGTPAHSFGEGSAEDVVVEILRGRTKAKIQSTYHSLVNVDGYIIDVAHHGPSTGRRNWLHGNEARWYLKSTMMDELDHNKRPADLYLRGHYHSYVKEWATIWRNDTWYESWMIVCPPLCMPGDFTRQATKSIPLVAPGLILLEIINNKLVQTIDCTVTLDVREEITI
jgi:hypothetical protein